jgi:uncharacterized membrane protein
MNTKSAASATPRFDAVDALRGLAMVWMTVFHFSFDLNQFAYIKQNFYHDPVWTWQRTLIVSLFLFCAGLGQAIAVAQGQSWQRFWRRWAQVLGCALLVSAGSWWMYPKSFIYFGVLHGMAVLLIIARLTVGWGGRRLWWLGGLALLAPWVASPALQTFASAQVVDVFNSPQLNWLGLITRLPVTEDYVPLLPWLGVMWWGVAAGSWLSSHSEKRLSWPVPAPLKPLATLGRWSLSYYMLHQPVMIGVLMVLAWLAK